MSDNEKNLDTEAVETPAEEVPATEEAAAEEAVETPEEGKVKGSDKKTNMLLGVMFLFFIAGLAIIVVSGGN